MSDEKILQIGNRLKVRAPKIIQHPPKARMADLDLATGQHVFPLPYEGVPPTMSPKCARCGSVAFTMQASGRVFCSSCQQTLGWLQGRIVLGADEPGKGPT